MSVWKDKRSHLEQAQMLQNTVGNQKGLNRRAVGLFPQPKDEKATTIDLSSQVKFHNLLVAIEGREETCVIRMVSPSQKARAAALVFRGRVLACVYGRDDSDTQLLGLEAFSQAKLQMLSRDAIIDTYKIDDKTAIAASSIFHGELYDPQCMMTASDVLQYSLDHLLESNAPGTIIINEGDGAKAIVYTFKGKVHGIFSYKDGWLEPSIEGAKALLHDAYSATISASKLRLCNIWELKPLTFSLTGLEEQLSNGKQYASLSLDYSELSKIEQKHKDSLSNSFSHIEREEDFASQHNQSQSQNNKGANPWKSIRSK
ncbi:hypothetical protein BH11CYA1_BH11CYA1_26350 [soil metagenome]